MKNQFPSFPDGKVAESIRRTISPEFADHDVESITIILVSHLMIERKINTLLLKWMADRLPKTGTKNKKGLTKIG
ncbi:MAG: hypothetical protein ABIJ59_15815 [Pseudomonadota bacterium]